MNWRRCVAGSSRIELTVGPASRCNAFVKSFKEARFILAWPPTEGMTSSGCTLADLLPFDYAERALMPQGGRGTCAREACEPRFPTRKAHRPAEPGTRVAISLRPTNPLHTLLDLPIHGGIRLADPPLHMLRGATQKAAGSNPSD